MAIGLNTTVTTPVITTTVTPTTVVTAVKVPGVAPNSDSLSTSVTTSGISTATVIPGIQTFVTDPTLTALVPGVLNSEPTISLFTSRQDEFILSSFVYKGIFKNIVENQVVPDIVQLAVSTKQFETAAIVSNAYITASLVKSDSTNSSIDFKTISIGKKPAEVLQTATTNYFNVRQVIQTIAGIIETKASRITKPLPSETVRIAATENINRQSTKGFAELVTTNSNFKFFRIGLKPENIASVPDTFARRVNYIRSYLNTLSIIATNRIRVSTYKQSVITISDIGAFYKVSDFTRNFTDTVLSSDDYYGLATIDDDQYASFTKRIAEQAVALETSRYYYANKVLRDQFSKTDIRSVAVNKPIVQNTLITDASKVNIKKYFTGVTDTVTSDYNVFTIKPKILNNTTTVDSLTRLVQYIRSYTTTGVVTDLLIRLVNYTRSYSDSYTISEKAYNKPSLKKLEVVATSEIRYSRVLAVKRDSNTISESKRYLAALVKRDTATIAAPNLVLTRLQKRDTVASSEIRYSRVFAVKRDSNTISESKRYLAELQKRDTATIAAPNLVLAKLQKRDSTALADLLTYVKTLTAITRLFTDQIRSTDSGTINRQNYFASSYVKPGYAGTNVIFGT